MNLHFYFTHHPGIPRFTVDGWIAAPPGGLPFTSLRFPG